MTNTLEEILINSILEQTENDNQLKIKSAQLAFSLLLNTKDLFENVPSGIYTSISTYEYVEKKSKSTVGLLKGLTNNIGKFNEDNIKFFTSKGILLYDGIHGSAFGRMNYIYRSKGTRIYLFEDGYIRVYATYCTIDHNGFDFSNDEIDSISINTLDSLETIENIFQYYPECSRNSFFNYSIALIQILVGIKKPFYKDYIIEYLLTPPDVNFISDFSLNIKQGLWDIFTNKAFIREIPTETQKALMSTLTCLGITPTTEQLLRYLELQEFDTTNKLFIAKLDIIQESIINLNKEKKEDIFEFKPNFNGIGINGNEILRRIVNKKKK